MSSIADRTVKVKLALDAKSYIASLAAAEAATKKFRDDLGKSFQPWDKETQRQKSKAPRDGDDIAGGFARSFSRRLESAFKQLPAAKITAESSDAQVKIRTVRDALQELSRKQIGIDIDDAVALGEIRAIKQELAQLHDHADISIRTDAAAAHAELQTLEREVARLSGQSADIDVDVNAGAAEAKLRAVDSAAWRVNGRNANVNVNANVAGALANIGLVAAALAALPAVTTIAVGVGALGAAFTAAGAGAAGFTAAVLPGLGRINAALKAQESAAGGAGGAPPSLAAQPAHKLSFKVGAR